MLGRFGNEIYGIGEWLRAGNDTMNNDLNRTISVKVSSRHSGKCHEDVLPAKISNSFVVENLHFTFLASKIDRDSEKGPLWRQMLPQGSHKWRFGTGNEVIWGSFFWICFLDPECLDGKCEFRDAFSWRKMHDKWQNRYPYPAATGEIGTLNWEFFVNLKMSSQMRNSNYMPWIVLKPTITVTVLDRWLSELNFDSP